MKIRPMEFDDGEAVAALWEQLVAYHRQLDSDMPVAAPDGATRYRQRITERLDDDTHTMVFVAESNQKIVGYILCVLVDLLPEMFLQERAGFIADIFVSPDYRGQGIGRRLVEAGVAWFRILEVKHYELFVASKNTGGIAFWQAVGGRNLMIRMRTIIDT